MSRWRSFRTVLWGEVIRLYRDPLLWVYSLPLWLTVLLRFLPPYVEQRFGMQLSTYQEPMTSGFLICLSPVMIGLAPGMLLMEERDERVHHALRVTPLPLGWYFLAKVALPTALAFLSTSLMYPWTRLTALDQAPLAWTLIVLVASLNAPLIALLMLSFGRTKMHGFLIFRVLTGVLLLPVFCWWGTGVLRYSLAFLPAWWLHIAVWRAADGRSWFVFWLIGLAAHLAAIRWLFLWWRRHVAG